MKETSAARAWLVYTGLRIAVFVGVAAVLWLVGFRSWLLALLAIVLSMPVAYFLLAPYRDRVAATIAARQQRRRHLRAQLSGDEPPDA